MTPEEFLERWDVRCFYHFTDTRNITAIRANGGLHPLAELRRRGIEIPAPGGNDWSHEADERNGLDEYIHLCLFDQHPMEYVAKQRGDLEETLFLEIAPDVISVADIRLTADVSNKSGVQLLTLGEAVACMDFEVVYTRTDWRDPAIQARLQAAKKYELLIPSSILIGSIRNL